MMLAKAGVLRAVGERFEIAEIELAPPKAGEVLVRIKATGLCHSDLSVVTGSMTTRLPAVLGHEAAGEIEAVGEGVDNVAVGDRVVISWLPMCGHCPNCVRGLPQHCETGWGDMWSGGLEDGTTRMSLDGEPVYHCALSSTFAERMVIPAHSAIQIPDDVPYSVAALVGCAVSTGVGAVWNASQARPGDRVAVFGCGGVGMSAIVGARAVGAAQIVAVDVVPDKFDVARELGAETLLWEGEPESVAAEIVAITDGGVDHAFDATGRSEVIEAAFASTRVAGKTVVVGIPAPDDKVVLPARLIPRGERVITGSAYGSWHPEHAFPLIIDLYRRGLLPLDALISHRLELEQLNEGFDLMREGKSLRAVVEMP